MDRALDSRRRLAVVLGEPRSRTTGGRRGRAAPSRTGPRAAAHAHRDAAVTRRDESGPTDRGGAAADTSAAPPRPGAEPGPGFPVGEQATVPLPVPDTAARGRPTGGIVRTLADRGSARLRGRAGSAIRRWVPDGVRGARVDPGRPGAVALTLVAAVAAVVAAVGVWVDRPHAEPVPAAPVAGLAPLGMAADAPGGEIVVSVTGKVARPGLVRVADGARVAEVLEAAGGAVPGTDLAGVNLARKVDDGEQIEVGAPAAASPVPAPGSGSGAPAAAAPGGRIDLNRATLGQLDELPGIGPVTAQRIVDWRTRNGRFSRVDQLREIEGIGERRFGQLRELVGVG